MESASTQKQNANDGHQRSKLSPEDRMVSTYLEDRSEVYRDLVKVQHEVSDFKFPIEWYSFTDLSSCGKIPKLPSTSKDVVTK